MGKVVWDEKGLQHYDDEGNPTNEMQDLKNRLSKQIENDVESKKVENIVLKAEPEAQKKDPCSFHECVKCHYKWPPLTQIVKCPPAGGCQSPVLAIKLENCPICNEPPGKTRIRVDFTSQHILVKPICAGASSTADSHYVDIERRIYEPEVENK